jgi:hypothetical protein
MATGYDKILEQQKEMQKQVGKVHTHLMANSRVTSAILPAILFGGGLVALSSGMYRLYTGAPSRRRLPLELACTEYRVDTFSLKSCLPPEPVCAQALASVTCKQPDIRVTSA